MALSYKVSTLLGWGHVEATHPFDQLRARHGSRRLRATLFHDSRDLCVRKGEDRISAS
jgi:hypothetical protein